MRRSLVIFISATVGLGVGIPSASAATTIIGNVVQSNSQAVNSSQSASNGSGSGSVFILGDSTPTLIQSSVNVLSNSQSIGAPAPCTIPYCPPGTTDFTLIGNASQINNQGVNSQQVGSNGDGGTGLLFVGGDSIPTLLQGSFNFLVSDVILG